MAAVGKNPHFDRIRPPGLHQHPHIVIAFHNIIIRIRNQRHAFLTDITGIGNVDQLLPRRFQHIADGILGVMRQRQRRHPEIAHLKRNIGHNPVLIRSVFQPERGIGLHIGKHLKLACMVAVTMRDQQRFCIEIVYTDHVKTAC